MKNVDYSKIFSKYEIDPLRQKKIEKKLIETFKQKYSQKCPFRIIDIGCGSGNWLEVNLNNLSKYKNIKWFGVDNSEKMLLLVNNKNINISWIQASADALPLPSDYFSFVITEYTYHHFENKKASFKEIHRIINKKGVLMIRDIEPWRMQDWSLYNFFPEARNADLKRFLKPEILKTILKNTGFKEIKTNFQIINGNLYETIEEWFKVVQNRTHSQLHIISDKEYQDGIKRILDLLLNKRKELEEIISNDISAIIEVNAIK